jgi:hypothetical protein
MRDEARIFTWRSLRANLHKLALHGRTYSSCWLWQPQLSTLSFSYLPKASALAWHFRVGIMNPVLIRTEIDPKYLRPLVFLSKRSNTIFYGSFNKQFPAINLRLLNE